MKIFKLNNSGKNLNPRNGQNFTEITLHQKLDSNAQKLVILPGAIPSDDEAYNSLEEIEKNAPDFFKFMNDAKAQAPESWNGVIFSSGFRDLIVNGIFNILQDMLPDNTLNKKTNNKLPEIILTSTKSMNQNILNMEEVMKNPEKHCFEEMKNLCDYLFKDCIFDGKSLKNTQSIAKDLGKVNIFAMSSGVVSAQELQNGLYKMLDEVGLKKESDYLTSQVCLVGISSFFKFFHPKNAAKLRSGFTKSISQTIEDIYAKKYGQVFEGGENKLSKEVETHEIRKNSAFISSSHPHIRTYKKPGEDVMEENVKDGTFHRPEWLLLPDPTLNKEGALKFNSLSRIVSAQIDEMLKSDGEVDFVAVARESLRG